MSKKYYWLKLKDNFFTQPKIKKLRKIAGGDTYTCIYLKLMLLTINNDGVIEFEGIENSLEAELSLKLDEDENNISVTLSFLFAQNLLVQIDNSRFEINELKGLIGSEVSSAERVRRHRAKKKLLHCNSTVT